MNLFQIRPPTRQHSGSSKTSNLLPQRSSLTVQIVVGRDALGQQRAQQQAENNRKTGQHPKDAMQSFHRARSFSQRQMSFSADHPQQLADADACQQITGSRRDKGAAGRAVSTVFCLADSGLGRQLHRINDRLPLDATFF